MYKNTAVVSTGQVMRNLLPWSFEKRVGEVHASQGKNTFLQSEPEQRHVQICSRCTFKTNSTDPVEKYVDCEKKLLSHKTRDIGPTIVISYNSFCFFFWFPGCSVKLYNIQLRSLRFRI